MAMAGGANYRHLGYIGSKCPNGNPNPHVSAVTMSSSVPVELISGPPFGPEAPTEVCPYCWNQEADDANL